MLHKHPSAEKAQYYFEITEKIKQDASSFFPHIQPKIGNIYDNSARRSLDENFNFPHVRDKHLAHLSMLLAGGIDHAFIEASHQLYMMYATEGVTSGEYIKLYQLIISYLSGEAHKKHWWRYKKYRDLNRAIRNLLLFDLAVGTSSKGLTSSTEQTTALLPSNVQSFSSENFAELQQLVDELSQLVNTSHAILHECHEAIQSTLDTAAFFNTPIAQEVTLKNAALSNKILKDNNDYFRQPPLFTQELLVESEKTAVNENQPAFLEILSQLHKKIQKIVGVIMTGYYNAQPQHQSLELMIHDIQNDIEAISDSLHQGNILSTKGYQETSTKFISHQELHRILHKSSEVLEGQLNKLEGFQAKRL